MQVERFTGNPIICPDMGPSVGDNINGPSLIRVPDWVQSRLGRYYLYFGHHDGRYIRLAYADSLTGPWTIHARGVLPIPDALFAGHVASPDVHVGEVGHRIRLYYHGSDTPTGGGAPQFTRVAFSEDGFQFRALPQLLGRPYFRVFSWGGYYYALAMPGVVYRSVDGVGDFQEGPTLFTRDMRHSALKLDGDVLSVFYSNVGDSPERILLSTIRLTDDWMTWEASRPTDVIAPEYSYEGGDLPNEPSVRGPAHEPVCQLRDPAIFVEDGHTYLLYSVAGERGIALAEIIP